jgi:hypothetical protein
LKTTWQSWTSWSTHERSITIVGRHFFAWRTGMGPWSIWEIDRADVPNAQIVACIARDVETRDLCRRVDEIAGVAA